MLVILRKSPQVQANFDAAAKIGLKKPLAQLMRAQAAIILIVITGYAAWDYHGVSQIYLQPESRAESCRDDTLAKVSQSLLFADQASFAALLMTPLTSANASWTYATAAGLLHYSPEPRVVEKLIESAVMLNRDEEAIAYLARFRAAFLKEHALWAKTSQKPL